MAHTLVTRLVPAPAAGQDFSLPISTTDRVLLLAIAATLTTSAAVANRRPALAFKDQSAGVWWSADAGYPQAASLAVTYSWARGASVAADPTIATLERVSLPIPWARLEVNDTVETITALIDVADQWSAIVYRAVVGDFWEEEQELSHLAQAFAIAAAG